MSCLTRGRLARPGYSRHFRARCGRVSTAVRWALAGLVLALAPAAPPGAAFASKVPAQPALYVVTGGQEGLYAWPKFPATIRLNSDTYLAGLHWARTSVALVVATGTLRQSTCEKSCASGPWVSTPVRLDASAPANCPVEATRALRYETYAFYERSLVYSKVVYVPEGGGAPAGGHQFLLSAPCPSGPLPTTAWPPVEWGPGAGTGPLRWTAPEHVTADRGSALVACASAASCVVVGGNPDVPGTHGQVVNESTEWDGHAWSKPVELGANGTTVDALACTGPTSCLAVDDAGQAMSFDGTAWSAPRQVAQGPLESVSCPTAEFCMAVGVVAIAYRQGRWLGSQPVDSWGPRSVSCPNASFCVAVDPGGHVVTYSGGTWSPPRLVAAGTGGLWAVSCPSERSCLAVDFSGRVLAWGGAGWSRPEYIGVGTGGTDVYASPLACASPQFCVLVDAAGNAFTYNGRSWSAPAHIDPRGGLSSVSCPSPRFCMAVDDFGDVVIGRSPGTAIVSHPGKAAN